MSRKRSDEEIEVLMEAERHYHTTVLPEVRAKIEQLRGEFPEEFREQARIEYLKGLITENIVRAWSLMEAYERYLRRDLITERFLIGEELEACLLDITKLQRNIHFLKQPPVPGGRDRITQEMIDRARAYPFERLYTFKRNMACCPFHDDRTPSMSLKNNRARCWGACNASWDPIAFVMKKEGFDFARAVRYLQ